METNDDLHMSFRGQACGLCESRHQTVFGVGHPRSHWMIVGEAPGEQEDLRGEPFVGPAGHLLDNMLRALGLTRAEDAPEDQPPLEPARQAYIANTCLLYLSPSPRD